MPSPFDQDDRPTPPASEWPTQPHWPAPTHSTPVPSVPPPPGPAVPAAAAPVPPVPPPPPAPPSAAPSPWQPAPSSPPVWQARAGGPPVGPPQAPPPPWGAGAGGGAAAPGPARRWARPGSRLGLAVAVVIALLVGVAAGGVASKAVLTSTQSASGTGPAIGGSSNGGATSPTVPGTGSSGSGSTTPGASGSTGSGSSSSGSGAQELSSWDDVVATVSVGVVNIESQMAGGVGAGTGMVLTADGEVLTNNHVVEGASAIVVTVSTTGESYRASIVGADPSEDVAVLQLADASGLATIPLGDSDAVRVGDQIAAIGNAGGKGGAPSVATGTVTALDQTITASDQDGSNAETLSGMIQVAAQVVPGDSGGPLANTSGQVVGMDSAASVANGRTSRMRGQVTTTGEGYAIPINHALAVAEELKASGKGASAADGSTTSGNGGFLGVQVQAGTTAGAEVAAVESGSPAATAGLAAGDTIVAVDGTRITSPSALVSALGEHAPGDRVVVSYVGTDGRTHQATVTLASR